MLSKTPLNKDPKAAESWLMLEGLKEADEGPLTQDYESAKLRESSGKECFLGDAYQRRPMTLFERQPGAAEYDKNGVAKPILSRILIWNAVVIFVPIVLVVFFGVVLNGSTQSFAPFPPKNYFAIAVAWSLVSSAILGWYIGLLGGSKTEAEVAAGLLATMALWLV
ncbi:hypothetical protein EPUS_07759 [Endocarpon pusillum Z07020]|uniref:Uncharacterized protein n=1 Tax=Endocarpon pusillum (strain Z07020 / HMAS-L-300199) TaxID=1263415 RepID=U1G1H2_ENDPU|nr:uncharacterized protein EPUS_07759 [Endocarpon pusillum Z07020]ERF71087.1 hypothetical protein EPUS_07759 [Endocarpon pusillum Z07020]